MLLLILVSGIQCYRCEYASTFGNDINCKNDDDLYRVPTTECYKSCAVIRYTNSVTVYGTYHGFKGVLTPNQKLACLVPNLKIVKKSFETYYMSLIVNCLRNSEITLVFK